MSAAAALTKMSSYGKQVTSLGAVLFEKFPVSGKGFHDSWQQKL